MSQLKFYLDNKPSPPPANWKELEIELSFENNRPAASVKTNSFEFLGDTAIQLNEYFDAGLNGGSGVFEGLPFRIEVCDASTIPFDGYIDLSSEGTQFECDKITAKATESGKIDWLNDVADSFSFAFLSDISNKGKPGYINYLIDYIKVPYVVSSIPNGSEIMVAAISSFIITKELAESIKNFADVAADIASVFTTIAGFVKALILIIYITSLTIALVKMIQLLIENIIQLRKNKLGMRVKKHFEKACEYLGLIFSSTILDSIEFKNLTIIPRKIIIPGSREKDEDLLGKFTGHFDGTFGDFIRAMNDWGNCEVKIIDNTLHWERKQFFDKKSDYQLPNINLTRSPYEINASEIASNYYIKYQLDDSELNTYDEYAGTSVQVIMQPIVINNKKNLTLKTLDQKSLQFALAKRKEKLNIIEEICKEALEIYDIIVNTIIGVVQDMIDAVNNIAEKLEQLVKALDFIGITIPFKIPDIKPIPISRKSANFDRIGWLKLSSDFIGVPKIAIIGDDGYLDANNKTITSANNLLEKFHGVNLSTRGNQWYIFKDKEIPLCCDEFTLIKNNNFIKTFSGEDAKVDSLVWNPHKGTAKITFRTKKRKDSDGNEIIGWTKNLTEKIIIDGN